MPRGSKTQTRTFNYNVGATVGIDLLSATNPENGTVTYALNSDHTLHTQTDAKSQVFAYSYDSYKRLTQVMVGSTVLRTFMYDSNTLDRHVPGREFETAPDREPRYGSRSRAAGHARSRSRRRNGRRAMIGTMEQVHMSEAEVAKNFAAALR